MAPRIDQPYRDLLRRMADALRKNRRHRELVAEADAALSKRAGRPQVITADEARRLLAEHGNAEAAARAHGGVTGETIRRLTKPPLHGNREV